MAWLVQNIWQWKDKQQIDIPEDQYLQGSNEVVVR